MWNYPNGESIASRIWHEYGTKKNIPRRSFLRMPFIERRRYKQSYCYQLEKDNEWRKHSFKRIRKNRIMGQNISKDAFATGGFGKMASTKTKNNKSKKEAKKY